MRSTGNARSLLVVALAASVAVIAASVWYLATSGVGDDVFGPDGDDAPGAGDPDGEATPLGSGPAGRAPRKRADTGDGEEDDPESDGILEWGSRTPEGDVFEITPDTLRKMFAGGIWTEVCRQIDDLQQRGIEIPEDVVTALFGMLDSEGRRLDAVMALGLVRDAAVGTRLADLAADASKPEAVRVAALSALARSGQASGVGQVRELIGKSATDTPVLRQACFALAAMGGPEASGALLSALAVHADDDLTDVLLTSLAKLRDGDVALAQALRQARSDGDKGRLDLVLRIGTRMGGKSGPELRSEIRSLVESPAALAFLESDAEERDRLRTSAIYVASAMGGDALDAVLALTVSGSQEFRQIAFNSLRNARGDEAATKIAALLRPELDRRTRYDLVSALGLTGSTKATPTIHAALDDPDGGVREAAAAALAGVRDPASVPEILGRLDRVRGDRTLAIPYLKALGQIGVNDALPKLEALAASDDEFWKDAEIRLWTRQAINRIRTGNPDSTVVR